MCHRLLSGLNQLIFVSHDLEAGRCGTYLGTTITTWQPLFCAHKPHRVITLNMHFYSRNSKPFNRVEASHSEGQDLWIWFGDQTN